MGTLYLVGTPIGNLEDISLRALRILSEVPLIAAEDTRVTQRLLRHYKIKTRLTSYHEHNKLEKTEVLLQHLAGADLALVSDAGMPGLSDPGYEIVKTAVERGFPIVPIPGPSALLTALVVSGLPSDAFTYLGFLPRKSSHRRQLLEKLAHDKRTLVAFEAPHRIKSTLKDIRQTLGERPIAIARELTKYYEEILRGKPSDLLQELDERAPKGEITLVIGGWTSEQESWDDQAVRKALQEGLAAGESPTALAKRIAQESGRPRRDLYQLAVEIGGGPGTTPKD